MTTANRPERRVRSSARADWSRHAWIGAFLFTLAAGREVSAQSRIQQYFGPSYGWSYARGLGMAGDVDFDGTNDVVVSSPSQSRVSIHSGRTGAMLGGKTFGGAYIGHDVDGAGDVNGDGIPDVIVSSIDYWPTGIVWIYSTQGFAPIQFVTGVGDGNAFGGRVRGAGDVDGDGHADYLVGAIGVVNPALGVSTGGVTLVSGANATPMLTVYGDALLDYAGNKLDSAGDIDGDGWADILVGVGYLTGYVKVCSGQSGALIHKIEKPGADSKAFGMAVANAGDVNADGIPDVVVGDSRYPFTDGIGRVYVYSGANAELLMTGTGTHPNLYLGMEVLGPGDLDGDGYDDVAAGCDAGTFFPVGDSTKCHIRVWSGHTGAVLFDKYSADPVTQPYGGFGRDLAAPGDLNADGTPDVLSLTGNGYVTLLSGKPLPLEPDNTLMTVSGGGQQSLRFKAGAEYGGDIYLLVGTTSGTSPGLSVGGVAIPLNYDAYTSFTVTSPNHAPLSGSLGVLSSSGTATSQFAIPPFTSQTLAGVSAYHVALSLDANGIGKVSNPVLVTLVP